MYDSGVEFDSGLSDGQTPPMIPAKNACMLAKKGMKLDGGIDLSNAIWTSAHTSSSFSLNVFDDEDPGPKRQCVTRLHPLNKYTRPAHVAGVSGEYGTAPPNSKGSNTSDEGINCETDEVEDAVSQASQEAKSTMEKKLVKVSRTAKRTSVAKSKPSAFVRYPRSK